MERLRLIVRKQWGWILFIGLLAYALANRKPGNPDLALRACEIYDTGDCRSFILGLIEESEEKITKLQEDLEDERRTLAGLKSSLKRAPKEDK